LLVKTQIVVEHSNILPTSNKKKPIQQAYCNFVFHLGVIIFGKLQRNNNYQVWAISVLTGRRRTVIFQLFFFFRGNQPASQAMPPTRAKIPKTKAQSRRANGTLMGT